MTERYTFTGDRSLLSINDSNVEWNSFNSTLTNTINDGYVTVTEQTQYLSALDDTTTNDINLENLSLTLTPNPKIEIGGNGDHNEFLIQQQQATPTNSLDGQQQQQQEIGENHVVVYTVEGSDELYGIQLAQDEEGNIQKYQFQFRKTEDGQLEAIPETIQILPLDEDEIVEQNENNLIGLQDHGIDQQQQQQLEQQESLEQQQQQQQEQQRSLQIYVQNEHSEEHILPDRIEELPTDNYNMLYTESQDKEEDIKPVTIEHVNIKQEVQDFINYNDNFDNHQEQQEEEESETNDTMMETSHNTVEQQQEQHLQNEAQQEEGDQEEEEEEEEEFSAALQPETIYTHVLNTSESTNLTSNYENIENDTTIKQLIVPEIHNNNNNNNNNDNHNIRTEINESDNDEYQVVEGLHITGDIDDTTQQQLQQQQQQQKNQEKITTLSKTNILKHNLKHPEKLEIKKDNRYFLYFVHHEKENVDSGRLINTELYKTNPRSILKPCYLSSSQKPELIITAATPPLQTTTTSTTTTTTTTVTTTDYDERLSKRFARNKEAIQARNLYNFINKTTIPLAPVRKDRLPRKQKIKPVERQDEQIVVQEMIITSNSFIESDQIDVTKRDLAITDYVELTDSDSDYNPNNNNNNSNNNKNKKKKKTKRYKLRNHITISDSSDEDQDEDDKNSVIELDDLSSDDDQDEDVAKKKRQRPPKTDGNGNESPLKKLCVDNDNHLNDDEKKTEIPCPKCSKSFPSQNSLKTHLQHHNLENTINRAASSSTTTTTTTLQSSHKCDKCNQSFKNRILLTQHKCTNLFTCLVCKKKFTDIVVLSKHKRTHIKQQLCRQTSTVTISPKKLKSPTKSPKFKSPQMLNKCKECGKVCSSLAILNVHLKSHNGHQCTSCKLIFPSKLLLDNHIRKDCVKLSKIPRTVGNLTKSSSSSSLSTTTTTDNVNKKKSILTMNCDECSMKFTNSRLFLKHKVEKHGMSTPDKSITEKDETKRLFKSRAAHSGIKANKTLTNIFADMQKKLNEHKETTD